MNRIWTVKGTVCVDSSNLLNLTYYFRIIAKVKILETCGEIDKKPFQKCQYFLNPFPALKFTNPFPPLKFPNPFPALKFPKPFPALKFPLNKIQHIMHMPSAKSINLKSCSGSTTETEQLRSKCETLYWIICLIRARIKL